MEKDSASYQRLMDRIAPIMGNDVATTADIEALVQSTPLIALDADLVRDALQLRNDYGTVVYAKLLSETPGENHYDYCYPHLLGNLEDRGFIVPGETYLLEASSGSASYSFGWAARVKGYESEIIIPDTLPPARAYHAGKTADHVTQAPSEIDFIGQLEKKVGRRIVELRRAGTKFYCPNHSQVHATPEAFGQIGREVNDTLPTDVSLDAWVAGVGNATTITGIAPVLREKKGQEGMQVIGYKGSAQRGREVTEYGIEGADNASMPFVKELQVDDMLTVNKAAVTEVFERYNRGKSRRETIGRSTAGALTVVRQLIEQRQQAMNILVMFYDKADRYGEVLVTDDHATYLGNGEWNSWRG